MKQEIQETVYELVKQIPSGKVATYSDLANIVNINPRYVGYVLHHNPYPGEVPCHRIVNAEGRVANTFAFGGGKAQEQLLEGEGVAFRNGKINLELHRHTF